ncbi:cation:proton antiporter family protein [Longirhabdus pacifica]|uniref:cation:proton antiporter family protein n=1 Tax=Longirhabdus pacifica TaxID=2305227 RepID=UPI0010086DA1|nr:cation:proton antiporter family protein [Longirhabdus pacifica]
MEHGTETSLVSLMIVVGVAFIVPIILHRFKLKMIPVVVAEIIAGLLLGKSGLDIIAEDEWLTLLSTFGLIYLMFLSGLEIDFKSFSNKRNNSKVKVNPITLSIVIFIFILAISYGLALLLMLVGVVTEPYLMTIIISTISLGVVVPVLKEKRLLETPLGQTLLMVTVVSDFVTMILLAFFISVSSESREQMFYLLLFFVVVIGVFVFIRRVMRGKVLDALKTGTVQMGTRAVFALILLFVVLSETLQVEMILGAFLAGVIVSVVAPNREFIHQLDSFGYGFLIPIFFVMIGVNMNVWELLTDVKVLFFIPLLLAAIFISKFVPALILRFWYSWKEVLGSGILLSSTLSLVIVAATVAVDVGIIDETMQGALILVAVLSCLIAPILFNQVFPDVESKQKVIAIVGANHITLPVSQDLIHEGYSVEMYSAHPLEDDGKGDKHSKFPLMEVPSLSVDVLTEQGAFNADVIVFGTMDDDVNIALGNHAKSLYMEQVIVRIEDPAKLDEVQQGVTTMSTLYASRMLLKAVIEHPSAVKLMTDHDDSIQEVEVNNGLYHNVYLKDLPFLDNTLILRIYRGDSFIIPHGTSQIQMGDRLLVSGDIEPIQELKLALE